MSKLGLIALTLFSSSASARCEIYSSTQSVMFGKTQGLCVSLLQGIEYTTKSLDSFNDLTTSDKQDYSEYWADWSMSEDINPILSRSLASNYVGIGVWVPSELEKQLESMNAEEWLKSHGLLLSFGFGDMNSGKPRMRLDYRWHEKYDGDVVMQVELPF